MSAGHVSPVELLDACLDQVRLSNQRVNAVVTLNPTAHDQAEDLERRLAAGENPGALTGLPVGIKDTTPVAGLRTTYGSLLHADHVPDEDALVVRRLRAAGAVILGKTNTPEFAAGANTCNEVFGRTRNPWNPGLSAGGSTGGGAAALASGMIALAEGTDLGGSLRVPASFCGVVGLRPTVGLVPTVPSDWPADDLSVTGPLARSVEDVALMLEVIRTPGPGEGDFRDPSRRRPGGAGLADVARRGPRAGMRAAYVPDVAGIGIAPDLESVCRAAAESLSGAGLSVEAIDLDLSAGVETFLTLRGRWMVEHHRSRLNRIDRLGEHVRGNIRAGLALGPDEIERAERERDVLRQRMRGVLERYDTVLTPCVPVSPFPVEQDYPTAIDGREMRSYIEWIAPTFVLSLTGLPVASVPAGLDRSGLPVGIQVVGAPLGEGTVLSVAAAIEALNPIGPPRPATGG